MNILLIGCGSIGKRHIVNLLEIVPHANIYILRSNMIHDEFTASISAKLLRDWEEITFPIALAIVACPSALHQNHILQIIERKIPAYIEKPLVTSISDLNLIKHQLISSEYNQPTMMGCNLRFLPSLMQLKTQIDQGKLGKICRAIFEVGQYLPQWRPKQDYRHSYSASSALGGGVIYDLVHELDLVRYLLGEFSVISSQYAHLSHLDIQVEDTAVIHLGRESGPFVSVQLDYISQLPTRNIKIVGEKGTLIWDLIERKLEFKDESGSINLANEPESFDVAITYKTAMHRLLNAIQNNTSTVLDILEGIRSTELMLACKPQ